MKWGYINHTIKNMNHHALYIHALIFKVNTATIYPSASIFIGCPLHRSSTVILLWLCFPLGQQQWHKEPFKPNVEQTCKVRAAKQPRGPSLFRGTACYVDLANIWRPPWLIQKPGPHRKKRSWSSTSVEGLNRSQDSCLTICVLFLKQLKAVYR